jgi:energy-coupling factor transporter ATP-binding protein EcfA2
MSSSNPFATRFTRPGAIEFLFTGQDSLATLIERLEQNAWWGEIVGPHGSGKSTLLASLAAELAAAGRMVVAGRIRSSNERGTSSGPSKDLDPAQLFQQSRTWTRQTQLVLDSYEQLSWWSRRRLESLIRRCGAGLVITTHRSLGLPPLWRTEPSLELAQQVVARLTAGDATITPDDVAHAFQQTHGNLRETLFALYDTYRGRSATVK